MLSLPRIARRLVSLMRWRRQTPELDEEMRFHLEMETERRMRDGMDAASARAAAIRDFGDLPVHRDEAGDARGVRAVEDFVMDLRVGVRALFRQRTYAAVAVLTLALGIGGTTALGTAVYRVLLAPYPFAEADRIVTLWQTDTRRPGSREPVAPGNFLDWKARARSFDLMASAEPYSFDWVGPDGPERFETALVSADFFPLQGLPPLLGRTLRGDDFEPGRESVVVLTEEIFRGRFGSDSSLIGRTLVLDSVPRVVVGVMTRDAMAPFAATMWAPKVFGPDEPTQRGSGYWQVVARLAPGVPIERARAELAVVAAQLAEALPATNRTTGSDVITLREAIGGDARRSLVILFGAVAFVMLIACVNVATLQMGEAVRRRREFAVRTAIGAGRGRLVRQVLTESLLVATIGSVAGLVVASVGIGAIRAFAPDDLWQLQRLSLDAAALVLAALLALLSALAIGVMPVLATSRIRLAESLAGGTRGGVGGVSGRRANRYLVVSEVALALVLLVGAGLLFRSLAELGRTERGFATEGVVVTDLQAWGYYPTPPARAEFVRQAVERIGAVPGVDAVGVTSSLPLQWPIGFERGRIAVEGFELAPGDEQRLERIAATTPGYFAALRIPLLRGRLLDETDRAGAAPAVLVNAAFVQRYFSGTDPLGKRVTFGFMSAPIAREIVGVVGDVRHDGLHADPPPAIFLPHAQAPTGALQFVVRSELDGAVVGRALRTELAAINGAMPLEAITTMDALVARSLHERRFQLALLASFSATALLLAAIGIYGVMSRATTERTHEIGVRLAVGAEPAQVRWMVLRTGGGLALTGVAAGLAIALLLTRSMRTMLFGVTPVDPLTYASAAAVLLAAALAASWIPAWRASAVDPVVALRDE